MQFSQFEWYLDEYWMTGGGGGGGGLLGPPSTFRAITLQRAKLSPGHFLTFFFWVSRTFDTKFVMPGGTVLKLHNFLYMHVGPKMAPKCDFVYKINCKLSFFA